MTRRVIVLLSGLGFLAVTLSRAEARQTPDAAALSKECYARVGPHLQDAAGRLTPQVRNAYLDWAEERVLQDLRRSKQTIPERYLAEARQDATVRDAIFGSVFPPDPSILQNYAHLCAALGESFVAKYRSLVLGISVARRTKGVETADGSADVGRQYQAAYWNDMALELPGSDAEKEFIRHIAGFMKLTQVSALDLYRDADAQQQLRSYLADHKVAAGLIAEARRSLQFGQRLKNAMVLLGQRPPARDPNPVTVDWLRHLAAITEARPTSTPIINGKSLAWPLFPIDAAPWPLLMPLAHRIPMSEASYIWEMFQGEHGPDRFPTYGPYRDDEDVMLSSLAPSRWFWDAFPDRLVHGGACCTLSRMTVDLYSALGRPAWWAGQPWHCNLIALRYLPPHRVQVTTAYAGSNVVSYRDVGGAWSAQLEQSVVGGPDVTAAEWYFDEDPGTQIHWRDLNFWP